MPLRSQTIPSRYGLPAVNLRQIEIFRAVMLSGSISDAARMLNVTQPGISRAVKHLELQLKVRLFQRLKGRLLPTEQARLLFQQVQLVYKGVQSVQDFAQSLGEGAHSVLRVVCSPSVGLDVVPRSIARLLERLPATRFALEILPSPALVEALVLGHADIGVCAAAIDHPMLRIKKVSELEMVCVAPPACGLAAKPHVTAEDVSALPFVAFDLHTFQGRLVADAFSGAKASIDPVVSVRFARTACSLVAAGVGVAFVDQLTAASVAQQNIDTIPIRPPLRIPVSIATPLHRPVSTAADNFAAAVAATLKSAVAKCAVRVSPDADGKRGPARARGAASRR
jgi:DNA-binding transcriptional LysR family regulator